MSRAPSTSSAPPTSALCATSSRNLPRLSRAAAVRSRVSTTARATTLRPTRTRAVTPPPPAQLAVVPAKRVAARLPVLLSTLPFSVSLSLVASLHSCKKVCVSPTKGRIVSGFGGQQPGGVLLSHFVSLPSSAALCDVARNTYTVDAVPFLFTRACCSGVENATISSFGRLMQYKMS